MIPKIIHYCWFGKKEKPALIKKCIKSWRRFCPEYKIIEWNEENFNIACNEFCKAAYTAGKWAFVTDYVRLKVLYEYGGIYMDTDVELIKPLDNYLNYNCFMGFQHEKYVNTGLIIGSIKKHGFVKENADIYDDLKFYNEDDSFKLTVCQEYTTELLKKRGLRIPCDGQIQVLGDIYIFPPEYFCPYDHRTMKMNKTDNTVAIHHFASSWWDDTRKQKYRKAKIDNIIHYLIHTPNRCIRFLLGSDNYNRLKKRWKRK